ncbi:MAG: chaperone modulator CbpM [Pseudomonadota bacterium]
MSLHDDLPAGVRVMDRTVTFALEDVCRACGARRTVVMEMVEYGIIEAAGPADAPEFHGEAMIRAQVAARLMRDLGVNLPGAALAIDLLRQLGRL